MGKFIEYLTEIADSSFKWSQRGRDYYFKNSNGDQYEVRFDGRHRRLDAERTQSEIEIAFVMLPKRKNQVAAGWKTGVGDAFKTFSTVKQIAQQYFNTIDLNRVDLVYFSAMSSEPSRMKLYDRFVPIILKMLGPNWVYSAEQPGSNLKKYRFENTIRH